jgi:hypothetical protein
MDSKQFSLIDTHAGSEILSEMDTRPSPKIEGSLDLSPSTVFGYVPLKLFAYTTKLMQGYVVGYCDACSLQTRLSSIY